MKFRTLIEPKHRRNSANAVVVICVIAFASVALELLAGWSLEEILQSCLTFVIVLVAAATRFTTRKGEADRLWITALWGKIVDWAESLLAYIERRDANPPRMSPKDIARTSAPVAAVPSQRQSASAASCMSDDFSVDDQGYD